MSEFELSETFHQFFKQNYAENYLKGFSWYGHDQIPSFLTSGQLNFIAVISEDLEYEEIRHDIAEFRQQQPDDIELVCIHQQSFEKFLSLNRSFAERLKKFAWHGSNSAEEDVQLGVQFIEQSGWVAWQLMLATADLYHDQSNNLRLKSLLPSADFDTGSNRGKINQLVSELSLSPLEFDTTHSQPIPFNFADPISIYLKLDQLILVSHNSAEAYYTLDLLEVDRWMDNQSATAIQFCTPNQLVEAVAAEDLVTARLMGYQHIWGADLLQNLAFAPPKVLAGAARVPSFWQFYGMSKLLFSPISEEFDRKIIHDLQNRLLNIRLQNELFGHFKIAPKGIPSISIPDRTAPTALRLKAIENLFEWWTDYYLELKVES